MGGFKHKKPEDAYFKHVIIKSGCWGWAGCKNRGGYARFRHNKVEFRAHVFSYIFHKGEPGDKFVCHTCDNPECSNPEHLFLGTRSDNQIDCRDKGRHPAYKLTVEKVLEIKRLLKSENTRLNKALICEKYNIRQNTLKNIISGRCWGDIKP